jgi:hypothetical protein
MRKPPTKRLVARESPLMLSNSLIFVVKTVMLLIPIYPMKRQIKLERKDRRNHKPTDVRSSEPATCISS